MSYSPISISDRRMKGTTADNLVQCCMNNKLPPRTVVAVYFGNYKNSREKHVVWMLYNELVDIKDVDAEDLHNCRLRNNLNELVHAKFKFKPTKNYKKFCRMNIDLSVKSDTLDICEYDYEILDDDHCPNCSAEGFHTENNGTDHQRCVMCSYLMCSECFWGKHEDERYEGGGEDVYCQSCWEDRL